MDPGMSKLVEARAKMDIVMAKMEHLDKVKGLMDENEFRRMEKAAGEELTEVAVTMHDPQVVAALKNTGCKPKDRKRLLKQLSKHLPDSR